MKFEKLPEQIQIIAAETLSSKLLERSAYTPREPVESLAQDIRGAFIALFSPQIPSESEEAVASSIAAAVAMSINAQASAHS